MKSMAKVASKRNVGREILEGLRELKRGDVGRVVSVPPVAAIRERTGLSQAKFAVLLGVSVRTLQEIPMDQIDWSVKNSHRQDVPLDPFNDRHKRPVESKANRLRHRKT